MPGILDALNLGQSGMRTSQKLIEVTGNNVANVNTQGYSKQGVDLESLPTVEKAGLLFGQGVTATRISREHNKFLASQIQNAAKNLGELKAQTTPLTEIERIVNIDKGNLASQIDEFFAAWQQLSTNPGGEVERGIVLRRGQQLATHFSDIRSELDTVRSNINGNLRSSIESVNTKLQELAHLNTKIMKAKAKGQNPNTALDKRDMILKELATKLGTKNYEDKDGSVSVYLPGGTTLVQGGEAFSLQERENQAGQLEVVMGGVTLNIQRENLGGEFRGLMDVRDNTLVDIENQLNELEHDIIITVNAQHEMGTGLDGVKGRSFFQRPTYYQSDKFTLTDNGFGSAGGDDLSITVDSTTTNISVNNTDTLEDIRDKINASDAKVIASVISDGNRYRLAVTAKDSTASVVVNDSDLSKDLVASGDVLEKVPGVSQMKVAIDDVRHLAAGKSSASGDNRNALEIAALKDSKAVNDSNTFGDFYGKIAAEVGIENKQNELAKGSAQDTMDQLENRREAIAGVSINESMINLQKYQRGFQASAKFVATVDEMLQTLLSLKR